MIPEYDKQNGVGVPVVTTGQYHIKDGEKILKVIAASWDTKEKLTYGFCPYCGFEVMRLWNLDYCGNCGKRISWHGIHVENYGDLP